MVQENKLKIPFKVWASKIYNNIGKYLVVKRRIGPSWQS